MENTLQIKSLGNIYNSNHSGSSFGGYVWDKKHVCPCLNAMQGGGRTPMIIERINNVSKRNL